LSVCVSSSTAAIGAHSLDCSLGACRQPVNVIARVGTVDRGVAVAELA
jgi:hypothetical protein